MRWDEMWRLGDKAENVDRVLKLDAQHSGSGGCEYWQCNVELEDFIANAEGGHDQSDYG